MEKEEPVEKMTALDKLQQFLEKDPIHGGKRSAKRKAVENNGIDTLELLEVEYHLVQDRKSKLSAMERVAIVQLYEQIR